MTATPRGASDIARGGTRAAEGTLDVVAPLPIDGLLPPVTGSSRVTPSGSGPISVDSVETGKLLKPGGTFSMSSARSAGTVVAVSVPSELMTTEPTRTRAPSGSRSDGRNDNRSPTARLGREAPALNTRVDPPGVVPSARSAL